MREIRTSGSEGGGAGNLTGSPYPYQGEAFAFAGSPELSDKDCRRDSEALGQGPDLADVQISLPHQCRTYCLCSAELREVLGVEAVLLHEVFQHLRPGGLGNRHVLLLVGMDEGTEGIEKSVQRMLFVVADLREQ